MDWVKRMNMAINYIEENIAEELEFSQIAKVAHCSANHFQRMFVGMTDIPLSEYIRRRKMSLAVADLKKGKDAIIDIALKYGYSSPTAFNRAFQSVHGIAPSLVKQDGVVVKSYPPISFKFTIKGVEGLHYRVEKKEDFRVVGISAPLDKDSEVNGDIMFQMWQVAEKNGTLSKLVNMMDGQVGGLMGIILSDDPYEDKNLRYLIAVSSTKEIDDTLEEHIFSSSTWAIFSGEGTSPEAEWDLWARIMGEWLPTSGYELGIGPEIEVRPYDNWKNTKFEAWVSLKNQIQK